MRRENSSKRNWHALGALLAAAIVSLGLGVGTAKAQQPPGTSLIYSGYNSYFTDGNLSNANEWYYPVSGTPYNAVPGASDAATIVDGTFGPQFKIPNGTVTGSLNCWGAGFNAREEPLTIDASVSTGDGGLAISGDPYGPSAANLQVAASTTGPALTQAAVNINAALTAGAWMSAGGNTQINNTSVSSKGLVVVGTSVLGLNSGATLTTGQVGTIPPAITGADFYSTTTALQVEASSLYINSGSLTCNGDAVIGTIAAETGLSNIGVVSVAGGGSLTTTGVTRLGVINPNGNYGPPLQGQAGTGDVFVSGSGSLWHAEQDVRVGDDTQGSGFIYVQSGGALQLEDAAVRLGSSDFGFGMLTFDGSGGNPTLTSSATTSIVVGDRSLGELTVQNGASITHGGTLDVGNAQTSNGTVSVTGTRSSLTVAGAVIIGDGGVGNLSLDQKATLHALGDVVVGAQLGSVGTATLSDPTTTFTIDGSLTVGRDGFGASVTVENGAVLKVNGPSIILGQNASGDGKLIIDGPNSQVTADGATSAGAKLIIGQAGSGTLSLTGGGSFTGPAFVLGVAAKSSGTVKVDGSGDGQPSTFTTTGSTGANSDGLVIGGAGSGELDITNGGLVVTPNSATIASGSGPGTVTISGTDSRWQLGNPVAPPGQGVNPGNLVLGAGTGKATLNVQDGATLSVADFFTSSDSATGIVNVTTGTLTSANTFIGTTAGAVTATVSGNGTAGSSKWIVSGNLSVEGLSAQLMVTNGGLVTVNGSNVSVGPSGASIDVSNGRFSAGQSQLKIGAAQGRGELFVEHGGIVTVGTLMAGIGANDTGNISVDGSVQPNGTPATLSFTSSATIGEAGTANLYIVGGGVVSSDNLLRFTVDGTSLVNCTGTGSLLQIPHMVIYTGKTSYLSVEARGTIEASGVLLNSLDGSSFRNSVTGGATLQVGVDGLSVGASSPAALTIDGGTVQVLGPINIGSTLNFSGTVNVSNGSLTTSGSTHLRIGADGASALNLNDGGNASAPYVDIGTFGSLVAEGTSNAPAVVSASQLITIGPSSSGANLTLNTVSHATAPALTINNGGSLKLTGGGSVDLGATLTAAAHTTVVVHAGGNLVNNGAVYGKTIIELGGTASGKGIYSGGVMNGGFLGLGDPVHAEIDGDYVQTATGQLDIEIAGSNPVDYDQLGVTGNIDIDPGATLNLDFIGGFAPTTGETFDILSGPSLSSAGAFSNINVIGLEPGWRYAVQVQNGIETIESLNNGVAVPEPSSLVLALGFFGAMGLWWRWSRTTRLPHWSRGWTPAPN